MKNLSPDIQKEIEREENDILEYPEYPSFEKGGPGSGRISKTSSTEESDLKKGDGQPGYDMPELTKDELVESFNAMLLEDLERRIKCCLRRENLIVGDEVTVEESPSIDQMAEGKDVDLDKISEEMYQELCIRRAHCKLTLQAMRELEVGVDYVRDMAESAYHEAVVEMGKSFDLRNKIDLLKARKSCKDAGKGCKPKEKDLASPGQTIGGLPPVDKAAPKGVDEEKYKRCKKKVKKQSPGVNEYAVCTASLKKKSMSGTKALDKADKMPGGLGDNKKDSEFDKEQLEMGIKHELEHTKDKKIAKEIAKDHLTEDPKYYTKLKKIEKEKEVEKKSKLQEAYDLVKARGGMSVQEAVDKILHDKWQVQDVLPKVSEDKRDDVLKKLRELKQKDYPVKRVHGYDKKK